MKNNLILTVLVLCISFSVRAQFKVNESFEGLTFPPSGWNSSSQLGIEEWERSSSEAYDGTASAFINYETSGGEDWLITPKINNIRLGDSLMFSVLRQYTTGYPPDSLYILVSTTTNALPAFTTQIGAISVAGLPSSTWVNIVAPLGSFLGQNIYIAFKHRDTNGNGMWLDKVMAGQPYATDVAPVAIMPSGSTYYNASTTSAPMTGIVKNNGSSIATFTVTRKITPGTYSNTQTVVALAPGASRSVSFAGFSGFTPGAVYTIKDSVYILGDSVTMNDTISTSYIPNYAKTSLVYYDPSDDESRDSMISNLNAMGLNGYYDIVSMDQPVSFSAWRSAILLFGSGNGWNQSIRDSMKTFLDNSPVFEKKSLLIFGNDLGYIYDRAASSDLDSAFFRNYLHAAYIADNWLDDIPAANGHIAGRNAFAASTLDSVYDDYPDYIMPMNGGLAAFVPDYAGATGDTAVAVYYNGPTYSTFYGSNVYSSYKRNVMNFMHAANTWVVNNGGALPVELLAFNARALKNNAELSWSTASEQDNKGFYIERSADGKHFGRIAFVKGKGDATSQQAYVYMDEGAQTYASNNVLYYRLRQVDMDGTESTSLIASVSFGGKVAGNVSSLPNPFVSQFVLHFESEQGGPARVTVVNLQGQTVMDEEVNTVKGVNDINFTNLANLPEGTYFLHTELNGTAQHHKLIKAAR